MKNEKNSGKNYDNSPYDPLEVAKSQGKTFAAGISGHYRKNAFTRIGFIIIGIFSLIQGSALGYICFVEYLAHKTPTNFIAAYFPLILALALILIGVFLVKNALKKK